jgi:hypothetical protein
MSGVRTRGSLVAQHCLNLVADFISNDPTLRSLLTARLESEFENLKQEIVSDLADPEDLLNPPTKKEHT